MKISKNTLQILKNFSMIQNGIIINSGQDCLVSISEGASILANAPIEENFPVDFAIYDIGQFLNTIQLFKEPVFDFNESYVTIHDEEGRMKTDFHFSQKELITEAPVNEFDIDSFSVHTKLTQDIFKKVIKSSAIMGLRDLRIKSEGDKIIFEAFDKSKASKNVFGVTLSEGYEGKDFEAHFLVDTIRVLLDDDYKVGIVNRGGMMVSQFTGSDEEKPNRYWICLEESSILSE